MSKRDKYAPDYHKLYPGVTITQDVMRVLVDSDRKMKYCEYDLKTERARKDGRSKAVVVFPAREDSLDRLMDENEQQYALEAASPEETVADQDEVARLRQALQKLKPDEYALIYALYFEGITEREYAKRIGRPLMTVHNRKARIQVKLKKFLEN